jgi:hypothetical protein
MGKYFFRLIFVIILLCILQACKKSGDAKSAFYYWKSGFSLDTQQDTLLKQVANNTLYIRFFDIRWDDSRHKAFPDAIINFKQPVNKMTVTPVVFITNKTFENIKYNAIDSLAQNCNMLVGRIAEEHEINYKNIEFDCDWALSTREKYFNFLKAFKKINRHRLEATIRLHQVKYKERTGVPPVDKGILMFYNMGKLNANLQQANSIYNETDAEKYIAYIPRYPLALDIALPLFSWSVQIREGRVVQLYGNVSRKQLSNKENFYQQGNVYISKKSFFLDGIYVKENDTFKLEQTDVKSLEKAAKQLSSYLPPQKNRTIIYYELGNLNLSEFKAEALNEVSADL